MTILAAALAFPAIDPIAISFGPFAIKWYGLAYMAGLVLGWLYVKRLIADTRLWA
ncbi:MAG: prolipoprotein diacylglyceryl transferase family protein, partial [Hyphomicrobium sp.]